MNNKMRIAFFILMALSISNVFISFSEYKEFSLVNNIVSIVFSIFWSALVVLLVNFFRTHLVENLDSIKSLGIWGYVWRALVVTYSAMGVSIALVALFIYNTGYSVNPSVQYTVVMSFLFSIFSVFTGWLFFSKNRISQAKWFLYLLSFNKA